MAGPRAGGSLEEVFPGGGPKGVFPEEAATSAGEERAGIGNRTQIHPVRCLISNRVNADYQDFKHKELTEKIIKIFYKVYNNLGYGFLEKVYENAMMLELRKEGIPAVTQSPIKVIYEGEVVGEYFADILVANKVIVEVKAASRLVEENEAQLLNYLKATNIEVGLLLNFGAKAEVRRKAFNNIRK